MKFHEVLSTHLTPEWQRQYINYEDLRQMIRNAVDNAPHVDNFTATERYFNRFEEVFFKACEDELRKINTFYAEKLAEVMRKHNALMLELQCYDIPGMVAVPRTPLQSTYRPKWTKRKASEFKFAFSESYLQMVLLQNYQTLNYTGFRKILKKYDKLLVSDLGKEWFQRQIESAAFHTNRELINLIRDTEDVFTNYLEGGDRARAMKRLRVPPMVEQHRPFTAFRVGLYTGAFVVLVATILISMHMADIPEYNRVACIRLHRGPLVMIVFLFLISLNVAGWRRAGVNHILIFEIDPRNHLTQLEIMAVAGLFAVIWALSILGFIHWRAVDIPPFVFPLLLFILMVVYMLNPLPISQYSSRKWLLRLLGRVISAPFFNVGFADFWMGDQMNSLTHCIIDFHYTVYYYVAYCDNWYIADDNIKIHEVDRILGPIVRCLPAWFRFAQCLRRYRDTGDAHPFLTNAGKYASTIPSVVFSTLAAYYNDDYENTFQNPYIWEYVVAKTVSSCYCLAWDMLKDFGVFKNFSGENIFLRDQIIYPKYCYYLAMVENALIRFFWTLNLYLVKQRGVLSYTTNTVYLFLEVFRRFVWNFFRLENEHLFNAGRFRAVRDISIGPMEQKDQISLSKMMDEVDGVKNRGSDKKSR